MVDSFHIFVNIIICGFALCRGRIRTVQHSQLRVDFKNNKQIGTELLRVRMMGNQDHSKTGNVPENIPYIFDAGT